MKNLFGEFKAFAIKGNVLDLAVGVIIGAAFGRIVNSLVGDIIMPMFGMLTGNVDFSDKVITLKRATDTAEAVTLNYGIFFNTLLEFLIVGFSIFLMIKVVNRWKRKDPAPEPSSRECPYCYSVVSAKAKKCPNCTSPLTPSVV